MNPFARKPAASVAVPIVDPGTGEKTGVILTLASKESAAAKAVEQAQADRRFERMQLAGSLPPLKSAELEQDQVERLAACTMAWEGLEAENGAPMACTPANAKRLYAECVWIREQAQKALDNRTLFFGPSAINSSPSPSTSSGSPE